MLSTGASPVKIAQQENRQEILKEPLTCYSRRRAVWKSWCWYPGTTSTTKEKITDLSLFLMIILLDG